MPSYEEGSTNMGEEHHDYTVNAILSNVTTKDENASWKIASSG